MKKSDIKNVIAEAVLRFLNEAHFDVSEISDAENIPSNMGDAEKPIGEKDSDKQLDDLISQLSSDAEPNKGTEISPWINNHPKSSFASYNPGLN